MHRYSDEQKAEIIAEYKAAVKAGEGGGTAVAEKHGVHQAQIIMWAKKREGRLPAQRRPPDRTGAPVHKYDHTIEGLIEYHKRQLGHLEELLKGYAA